MEKFNLYKIMTGILAGLFAVVIAMAIINVANIVPFFLFFLVAVFHCQFSLLHSVKEHYPASLLS